MMAMQRKELTYNNYSLFFRQPDLLDECELDDKTKEVLIANIKKRLAPKSVKIRAGMKNII